MNETKGRRLTEDEIKVFLQQKIESAQNASTGGISKARQSALRAYFGEPYGNERKGYSKYVSREVLETVQWALPLLIRPFVTNDKVVVFDAENKQDEAQAELETQVANHYLVKQGDAFMAIYSFLLDALMFPNAYLKVSFEEKLCTSHQEFSDLTVQGVLRLRNDPNVEIIEGNPPEVQLIEVPTGNPQQPYVEQEVELYDLKIKRTKKLRRVKVQPCPPEEVLVDVDLRSLNLDEADFVCHRTQMTISDLRRMGISEEKVNEIPWPDQGARTDANWSEERITRLFYEDEGPNAEQNDDRAMRQVWVHECYAWMDVDGDGVAELWRVLMGGYHVLEMELVDYQPFVASSSMPVTHKHAGLSLVQIVEDLQRLKTELTRQLLDNLHRINRNRKYINQSWMLPDGSTQRALANPLSEQVRGRGMPSQNILEEQTSNALQDILPALSHFDEVLGVRSGTKPSINLDPNVLQQTTAEAFVRAQDQANQRLELMVRIIAETGIKAAMVKVHQLLRAHQNKPLELKLKDEWVEIDPTEWQDRTEVSVNVGLGSAAAGRNLAALSQLFGVQKEVMPMGLAKPQHLYATLSRMVEAVDLGEPSEFFDNPNAKGWQAPPPPQPDPAQMAQAEALKAQAQKFAAEGQAALLKLKTSAQETQGRLQLEHAKVRTQAQLKSQEIELKRLDLQEAAVERQLRYSLTPAEIEAKIQEVLASAELKEAQADKLDREPVAPEGKRPGSSSGAE